MFKIRKVHMTKKNKNIIFLLDKECFPYDTKVRPESVEWWIAYHEGQPVGYAGLKIYKNNRAFLARVGVLPAFRGKGLHSALIKKRVDFARKYGVEILVTYTLAYNYASINNLIKSGFILHKYHHDSDKTRNFLSWKMKI